MAIATNIRTKEDFQSYIDSLGLFRWKISETVSGLEAILSSKSVPNLDDFTQFQKQDDVTFWVRLSKKDIEIVPVK